MLENSILRQSNPRDLALYLCKIQAKYPHDDDKISAHIFAAVERESVPCSVLSVWLSVSRSPSTLRKALEQDFSFIIRSAAISRFIKKLRTKRWEETWDGIGGTAGLLTLLRQFSVFHVKKLLTRIPRCIGGRDSEEKRVKITELVRGLLSPLHGKSYVKSLDERPLMVYYSLLFPACTSEFVDEILTDEAGPLLTSRRYEHTVNSSLLHRQYKLLRQRCLDEIFESKKFSIDLPSYLGPLLRYVPGISSADPGYSESMSFSLDLLRKLVARPDVKVAGYSILKGLIEPLLWRARKKKLDRTQIGEIMDLSIKFLAAGETDLLWLESGGFLHFSVLLWANSSTQRPQFEARLISTLKIIPKGPATSFQKHCTALRWVRPRLRYKLFKILLLQTKEIDLDLTEDLEALSSEKWPCSLFVDMERASAVSLLRRLRQIHANDNFLQASGGNSVCSVPSSPEFSNTNPSILLILLEQDDEGALDRATSVVEQYKSKAVKSRQQPDRAFYAKSALCSAIASDSLELYSSTLTWARRYVREHLTAKEIFHRSVCNSQEAVQLLSGIPKNHEVLKQLSHSDIHMRIVETNRIVFSVFEIACLAMREPQSFNRYNWAGPLSLLAEVVTKRFNLSSALQHGLQLSDDQIYDTLWSDTLEVALRLETLSLLPEYEALDLIKPTGMLNLNLVDKVPSSYRFIDNLARERDGIWRKFRPSVYPAAAALPLALPHGLPIQCFAQYNSIADSSSNGLTPFISARAEAVLFPDPQEALRPLPEDSETRNAVGTFVDSFSLALQIYVLQSSDVAVQQERTMRAWSYALTSLSSGRMTKDEAHRTWKPYFQRALPKFKIAGPDPEQNMEYPKFPFDIGIGESNEWSPSEEFHPVEVIKPRLLQPSTYLDYSLSATSFTVQLNGLFEEPKPCTEGVIPVNGSIWSANRLSSRQIRNPAIREGLTVMALLYLQTSISGSESILSQPFPSKFDVRYASLWLDLSDDCMQDGSVHRAIELLNILIDTVPSTLLLRLTGAALEPLFKASPDLSTAELANLEHRAYGLLTLLARSDSPHLASDYILKVVMDRPDSSSWHRQLLSTRFLRKLSGSQARNIIQAFSSAIQQRMKEQLEASKQIIEASGDGKSKVPKPYIKITTVKYLAQILNNADFVAGSFSIDILSDLFQKSTHLDVRSEILASMLAMLSKSGDGSLQPLDERIISALEFAIPMASDMDERKQLSETDWVEIERTQKLPEVYEQGYSALDLCIPPILAQIIAASTSYKSLDSDGACKTTIRERVLYPILKRSMATNSRWLAVFARKHGLEFSSLNLPLLPVKPYFLKQIVHRVHEPPASLLELYHRFIVTNISPPPEVALFNRKLLSPDFRNLPETKHWLSLYGHGPEIYSYNGLKLPAMLLDEYFRPMIDQVQRYVLEQAELLLFCSEPNKFDGFMQGFEAPTWGNDTEDVDMLGDSRPALKRIITLVESMRTSKWQRDPNRKPSVLPDMLKYKLWLLPYPLPDVDDDKCVIFANALREFVIDIGAPGNVYHDDLLVMHAAAAKVLPIYRAEVACQLGALKKEMTLVDLLCVEIAETLFKSAAVPDKSAVAASRKVLDSWLASDNEWIRKKGDELQSESVFRENA